MAKITGILCQVVTGDISGAGTDGRVFLGLAGREFRLDSSADDFERGSLREYIMGRGPIEPPSPSPPQIRVNNPQRNDPREGFPLDTENLSKTPIYVRFEPESAGDAWNVAFVAALVYRDEGVFVAAFLVPEDFESLWMGKGFGEVLHLTDSFTTGDVSMLERGRSMAARKRPAPTAARKTKRPAARTPKTKRRR